MPIEMIYKVTCDHCPARGAIDLLDMGKEYSLKGETILREFMKRIEKLGWRRIDAVWACPSCVRSMSAEDPPKVRKPQAEKASRLSKTARAALAQRMIDNEDRR